MKFHEGEGITGAEYRRDSDCFETAIRHVLQVFAHVGYQKAALAALWIAAKFIECLDRIDPLEAELGFLLDRWNILHRRERLGSLCRVRDIGIEQRQVELHVQRFISCRDRFNTEEVDFSTDVTDLRAHMKPSEQHLIKRLVASQPSVPARKEMHTQRITL